MELRSQRSGNFTCSRKKPCVFAWLIHDREASSLRTPLHIGRPAVMVIGSDGVGREESKGRMTVQQECC